MPDDDEAENEFYHDAGLAELNFGGFEPRRADGEEGDGADSGRHRYGTATRTSFADFSHRVAHALSPPSLPLLSLSPVRTRKEIMQEVVAKAKSYKMQRQQEKRVCC